MGNAAGGGAGIAASQEAINLGANTIITGSCGPNAMMVLSQSGVKVYGAAGNVKDAVGALLQGKLTEISTPVPPHSGLGRGLGGGRGFGGRGFGRGGGRP